MDLKHTLDIVTEIAYKAGKYLKEEQTRLKLNSIETKSQRNYVTYIDKEAEKIIVSELSKIFPDTGFLTEEGTIESEIKEWTWIIDPLDGTTNYIHGDTPYSVSIALQYKQQIVLGIVYDPVADELYSASNISGAKLNENPIEISKTKSIQNAYIGFGIPYNLDKRGKGILYRTTLQYKNCSFRIKGSAAIELCYVAAGRSDAYFHSGLSPWDVAAGSFILERAGGKITDFNEGNNYIFGKEIVASNGYIHKEIIEQIITE